MIKPKNENLLRFNKEKIKGRRVVLRVDFNLDEQEGKFYGLYRIEKTKETIKALERAEKVVLISHFGDPKVKDEKYSLKKLLPTVEKILKIKINFLESLNSEPRAKFNLLENIRFFKEEKENNLNFAKKLANLGEIFINEAFSVSHRKHTSIYLLPKLLPSFFGFQFEKEINNLNKFLKVKNFALILGGAKIKDKLPLIKNFLNRAYLIFLGGGPANTFLKAKGFEIGNSLFEEELISEIQKITSPKILIPFDFLIEKDGQKTHKYLGEIENKERILDIGEETLSIVFEELKKVRYILWNGPIGYSEDQRFEKGTLNLAKFLANLKKFVLVGGGDTLGFLEKKKLLNKFKNISTGGGAMLYYLANKSLPIFEK